MAEDDKKVVAVLDRLLATTQDDGKQGGRVA